MSDLFNLERAQQFLTSWPVYGLLQALQKTQILVLACRPPCLVKFDEEACYENLGAERFLLGAEYASLISS